MAKWMTASEASKLLPSNVHLNLPEGAQTAVYQAPGAALQAQVFYPSPGYPLAAAYPTYAPPYLVQQPPNLKRPREDKENDSRCDAHASSEVDYDSKTDSEPIRWNCSQIRSKINALIRSGEVKVTHFQKEIGVTSNSYTNFMKAKGPYGGENSSMYLEAHRYFRKREEKGIKMPKAKKARASDVAKFDVGGFDLEGESREAVAVYDNCDEVRKKIQAHLRQPGVTQAAFGRQVAESFPDGRGIQGKQVADFLKKKGETSGAESGVYYGSYVFFEKLRLKHGTKKSNARKNAEREFPGGRELRDRKHEWVFTGPGMLR